MISNIKEPSLVSIIFRWVLMIPAAFAGYTATYTIILVISDWILQHAPFSGSPTIPAAIFGSAVFIFIGVALAPLYRGFVSIALFTIHVLMMLLSLVFFYQGYVDQPLGQVLLECFFSIVGSGWAFYFVSNALGWDRLTDISNLWNEFSS